MEKLGAYEMVTGRRLWKNVYDELGGSPGSTSAATCTRRHYERLVLPYVRHLKGEDDKPLPPSKPRKQYKMAKEPRGDDGATERLKAKEEQLGQMMPGRTKIDPIDLVRPPSQEPPQDRTEQPGPAPGSSLPFVGASGCPEAYKRLLSSFYCKETHGIMSPLAKKKLLAQVSKAEALQCQEESCRHGAGSPNGEPQASPAARPPESPRSPGGSPENHRHQLAPQEGSQGPGGSLGEEAQAGPHLPAPTFTGCFHAYPTKVLKPISQHPRDFFPHLKDGVLWGSPGKEEGLPVKESALVWGGDVNRPSAFHRGGSRKGSVCPRPKACWVSPMAKLPAESPVPLPAFPGSSGLSKRSREEEGFVPGGKKTSGSASLSQGGGCQGVWGQVCGAWLGRLLLAGPSPGACPPRGLQGHHDALPTELHWHPGPLKGPGSIPLQPPGHPSLPGSLPGHYSPLAHGRWPYALPPSILRQYPPPQTLPSLIGMARATCHNLCSTPLLFPP